MTAFLLGISFIIHVITLLSLIIIWKRSGAADHQDLKAAKKEMEDILLAYTTEMKEENEAFLKELASLDDRRKTDRNQRDINGDEIPREKRPMNQKASDEIIQDEEDKIYSPPINEEKETFGVSLGSQIISLHNNGYSLDEIAKKVNKGKGEVELMIKFHRDGQ
ncbi:DUF6115 domain-containing protein [Bacillus sp. Marseille-Q3570]|uniref:DUF6115 domain-containing protein n=1 Tax=Bacillus sp. Marseille-Q3570 TaxID=2963522 RepID=UPI0021B83F0D|nr:hypothetical protein [Bacillus sp. Marseille-Q3570]